MRFVKENKPMTAYKNIKIIILAMIMVFTSFISFALEAKEIKERMIERIPMIQALKAKGIIGENNQGYLETMPGSNASDNDRIVVNDENSDRKAVYTAIAKQQGVDISLVGRRRTLQIVENAAAGEWLQDGSGKWYKK